jgi:ATP-binding cassette subfamily B (MDR/TAP) protein 1
VRAIISQGVISFDYSTPGSVVTDLSSNIDVIRNGLSEHIGLVLQSISSVVTGLIIAFFQSWNLTLVTSTAIVLLFLCSGIAVRFETALESKISSVYTQAAGLGEEALASIQILMAFGASHKIAAKNEDYLNTAKYYNLRKSSIISVKYAMSYFILLAAYAITFWYGIRLLLRGEIDNGGKVVMFVYFCYSCLIF